MINLAMDTAGTACAACLYDSDGNTILAEISEEIGRGHAERLMGIISDVLKEAKISYHDIGKIVTTIGPGSFTGIRVGVATARGFGLGLGIPVVGVTNLEAMIAHARQSAGLHQDDPIGVVLGAGRGQVYCQFSFDTALEDKNTPFLSSVTELADELNGLLSNGNVNRLAVCGNLAGELADMLSGTVRVIETLDSPPIAMIARIGAEREETESRPEPLYIRKPDAKPQTGFAVDRSG